MSETNPPPTIPPGTRILFLEDGLAFSTGADDDWHRARSIVSTRGQVIVVTAALRRANEDRTGRCFLDLAADADAQEQRWGKQMFSVLGDDEQVPPHLLAPEPGSVQASMRFERERMAILADTTIDEPERDRRLAANRIKYQPVSGQRSVGIRGNSGIESQDRPRTARG